MAGGLVKEARAVIDRTALLVAGAIDEPADAGMADRTGTHGAWLERHVEFEPCQAVIAERQAGPAQGDDLGMGRRVVPGNRRITPLGHDLPAGGIDDQSADRRLARFACRLRQLQRPAHISLIAFGHDPSA